MRRRTSAYPLLVVEPDPTRRAAVSQFLRARGFDVTSVADAQESSVWVEQEEYALAVVGLAERCQGAGQRGGLDALRAIRRALPQCQIVVILPSKVDLSSCCEAVSLGACSFVDGGGGMVPPGLLARLRQAVGRFEAIREEARQLHDRGIFDQTGFAGQSRQMAELLLQARRAAVISDAPVVIEGESGTGKQLLAEAIHRMDPKRRDGPFMVVNCSAITGTLAESALFGHCRGAFTGATEERAGYFRSASGGTILLDEVGELDKPLQPKLLRVLQEGRVLPVGSDREEAVDVRVIAASNRSLMGLVARGEFRLDLYQRLNVIYLVVPPLRQRLEDIPVLFEYFLKKYRHYYSQPIREVDERVYQVLAERLGRGNVRELENVVRRTLAFKRGGDRIELSDLPESVLGVGDDGADRGQEIPRVVVEAVRKALAGNRARLDELVEACERLILAEAISQRSSSKAALARQLGITRRTLYNKLRKYELSWPDR